MSVTAQLGAWRSGGRRVVHEADTKRLLQSAGIRVPMRDPGQGACVVKLASDLFPHKTDHGLVKLNVAATDARALAEAMLAHDPEGEALVEEMVSGTVCEWIVGCRQDPTFGPVIVVGAGGILVELLDAAKVRLAPTDDAGARSAITRQTAAKLLGGLRGKPEGDLDALVDLVVSLSHFFADNADDIAEIEINPAMVLPKGQGVVAADALMILKD